LFASNNRFYSAIGDHNSTNGNSFLYEYDPITRKVKLVGDVLTAVNHVTGSYGHGKIHAQINEGNDGYIYTASYRASTLVTLSPNYRGGVILRYPINTAAGSPTIPTTPAPVPSGIPSSTPTPPAVCTLYKEELGTITIEAENFHTIKSTSSNWVLRSDIAGSSNSKFMRAEPDAGVSHNIAYAANSPMLGFNVNFSTAGTYHVWIRGYSTNGSSDSVHVGLDGKEIPTSDRINSFGANNWTWHKNTMDGSSATMSITPGGHVINVWMREDGFRFDKIILTRDSAFVPSGTGPVENQCVPALTPTPTPISCQMPLNTPVLVLEYFPRDPLNPALLDKNETGWDGINSGGMVTIIDWENNTQKMLDKTLAASSEVTRYHGYKDSTSLQFLSYSVIDIKKIYTPIPRGVKVPFNPNNSRPNYGQILRDQNICDYVDNRNVKEVWMYGYHHNGTIEPDESRMSSKFGDISNSVPKEEFIDPQFRMPICNNSYVLYNFTYQPGVDPNIANSIHNKGHQIENQIGFVDNNIFWNDFSEKVDINTIRNFNSSCGNIHYTPNWRSAQDTFKYNIQEVRQNNCETWNPDETKSTYIGANCNQWGCTDLGFFKWWMQNIPGFNNGIIFNGQKMRNWWEATYDFNAFIENGKSLFGESNVCVPTTPPASTPTPTPRTNIRSDINQNGCVDIIDFSLWLTAFQTGVAVLGSNPDINRDGRYDLLDYNEWFITMRRGVDTCL
jgi:hypothetical protein